MKYQAKIVGLGPDALAFLEDEDMNFIIIFNEDAPPELAELSVLHTKAELKEAPAVGDTIKICKKEFKVSAVGSAEDMGGTWTLYAGFQGRIRTGAPWLHHAGRKSAPAGRY